MKKVKVISFWYSYGISCPSVTVETKTSVSRQLEPFSFANLLFCVSLSFVISYLWGLDFFFFQ